MTTALDTVRFGAVVPETILTLTLLAVLMLEAFRRTREDGALYATAIVGTLLAGAAAGFGLRDGSVAFSGMVVADKFRAFMVAGIAATTALSLVVAREYTRRFALPVGELVALFVASALGMVVLASTRNLGVMFLGLELMSLPLYALTAFRSDDLRSGEGAIKYFLLGSAAGAMFLLGSAMIYGESGTLDVVDAFARMPLASAGLGMKLGLMLLVVAIGFKLAWVPFHPWSPDAYEGAPAAVTAFMSTAVKVAVVAAAGRILVQAVQPTPELRAGITAMVAMTLVAGNAMAAVQSNIKRMLAYSSIAHAGYMGLAFVAGTPAALGAAGFYAVVYAIMNIGAFAMLIALSRPGEELESFDDLKGLGHRRGGAALLLTLFFLSLSGMPPLAGFAAKLFIFTTAVDAGATPLVVLAALTSVIGAYYYLRPVVQMYLDFGGDRELSDVPAALGVTLAVLAAALIVIGLLPGALLNSASVAVGQWFAAAP